MNPYIEDAIAHLRAAQEKSAVASALISIATALERIAVALESVPDRKGPE